MSRIRDGKAVKQVSIYLPIADWRLLHVEAAKQGLSVTALARDALARKIDKLRATKSAKS